MSLISILLSFPLLFVIFVIVITSVLFNLYDFLPSNEFRDFWLTAEKKRKLICPIGKMPRLALDQVIQSMDSPEQIKLALTSKRMEYCVKTAKIKVSCHHVWFRDEVSNINIDDPATATLFCGNRNFKTEDEVTRNELAKWRKKNSVTENMVDVYEKLQYLYPSNNLALVLVPDDMKKTSVKEVLSIPAFQKYKTLVISSVLGRNGKINLDELKHIMKTAKSYIYFGIIKTEVPEDFQSEHAFKFYDIKYEDARWVKIEYLFSLRNSNNVVLWKNNLNCSDFNSLIKYWVNCDSDMFNALQIEKNDSGGLENLFSGLVALECHRFDRWFCFIAAKSTENRKRTILNIINGQNYLTLSAYSSDASLTTFTGYEYKLEKEFDILKLLEKKEELEKELMETEGREQEIRAEIQEIEDKLEQHGVHYVNGKARIH